MLAWMNSKGLVNSKVDSESSKHISQNRGWKGKTRVTKGSRYEGVSSIIPRHTKFDFPRFNGDEDHLGWLNRYLATTMSLSRLYERKEQSICSQMLDIGMSKTANSHLKNIASQSSKLNSGEANSSIPLHPRPLNVGLSAGINVLALHYHYHASSTPDINCCQREWENLINHANGGVSLTGSALLGKVGPLIGSVDITESEDAYVFCVSLPGVARDESKFYI
ncbi:Alpha-crystallin domain-containing protein 22.3 [Capsicum baccatum]|uniref:Alpha-crystallin domain-containing protein 22.3 n=1 Tax=Capsicum baccatum TaxID=33114 RepID=A0A2G2W7D2_CAPBA|nr:Alpha-crystallin domain-containing protein 22.3 [Capsicum baccatum]